MMRHVTQSGSEYRSVPTHRIPQQREHEMLRLRTVEGLTFREIGERYGVSRERVRQLLHFYFGLMGTPPAVKLRRQASARRQGSDAKLA
jgi:hypothetical protein